MTYTLSNIRNKYFEFSIDIRLRIQKCLIKIGEVFVRNFAPDIIWKEYVDCANNIDTNRSAINDFINDIEDEIFSYTLSYLARYEFHKMIVIYSLYGLENIISDVECKCLELNFNYLIEQCELVEEKLFQGNHDCESIFSGYQDYKFGERIAEFIELAVEDKNIDEELQNLDEVLLQLKD